ncbi:hypothetical protein STEG23_030862, partial [Scotinomys teguina]
MLRFCLTDLSSGKLSSMTLKDTNDQELLILVIFGFINCGVSVCIYVSLLCNLLNPSLVLYLPPHVLWLPGNFYLLSSWRSGVFSSCCLALDSSFYFPCPAFRAIAKSILADLENHALFKNDLECQKLILEAMKYHLLPERRTLMQSPRTKPRKSTVGTLYAVGGMDNNK